MSDSILVAVGGNALIQNGQVGSIDEQSTNAEATARDIAAAVDGGLGVLVTHGNGPQVGFILLRSEMVAPEVQVPALSLEMSVADSQGGIGHILSIALTNALARLGHPDRVANVLTHTVVDARDPAFDNPTKPIGSYFDEAEADRRHRDLGWTMVEDAGRGYRRVVASPRPLRVVEAPQIRVLLESGFVVLAGGGGGIPVVEESPGVYRGVEAVIDKDFASAELANAVGITRMAMATGVERVALDFGTPRQREVAELTISDAQQHLADGQFPPGSMGPKVRAGIEFLQAGGSEVLITSPTSLTRALVGESGTRLVADPTTTPS